MEGKSSDMPVPFMGPPVLVDERAGVAVSQMAAIVFYLGEALDLLPREPGPRALTLKVVADANDVIDELTLDGGRQMWTEKRWDEFVPRLQKWMGLWEELGRRHGLGARSGHLLGGEAPGVADVVTATLWGTLVERFPIIGKMLEETAPNTAGLVQRVAALPAWRSCRRRPAGTTARPTAAVRSRRRCARSSKPDAWPDPARPHRYPPGSSSAAGRAGRPPTSPHRAQTAQGRENEPAGASAAAGTGSRTSPSRGLRPSPDRGRH
jgi:glutathione S-transferase